MAENERPDEVLPDSVRLITFGPPDRYPEHQIDQAFWITMLLGRGDFYYLEEPDVR